MDEGQDDKKGKKSKKPAGGKSTGVAATGNTGAKDTKTAKNGNFEVPQTSSK